MLIRNKQTDKKTLCEKTPGDECSASVHLVHYSMSKPAINLPGTMLSE